MFKNQLIAAWRTLTRNRTYTTINVLGLSLSVGIATVLFMIVRFEKSFDTWHAKAPQLYQLLGKDRFDGLNSHIPQGAIYALNNKIPGVEQAVNVMEYEPYGIRVNNENLAMKKTYFAGPELFHMIDAQWIAGSPEASLSQPFQVVLDEPTAIRFFKSTQQAMGQIIRYENNMDMKVSGIIKKMPSNTQFTMPMILSYASLLRFMDWYKDNTYFGGGDSYFQGFVLLKPGARPSDIVKALNAEAAQHKHAAIIDYQLVNLADHHFNPNPEIDFLNYAIPYWLLNTLVGIGAFLLLIASINFINMATVQAMQRNKATGVRKILGSSRWQLMGQFLLETGLLVVAALGGGALIAYILLPFTSELLHTQVADANNWNGSTVVFLLLIGLALTLLSGIYPAILLSGFKPIQLLRSRFFTARAGGFSLRRMLVVTQFTIALVLVICTLIGVKQLNHFYHKELGFDKASVLKVMLPNSQDERGRRVLRSELENQPAITNITFGLTTPSGTGNWWWANVKHHGLKDGEQQFRQQFIDTNYFSFFRIPLLTGRSFTAADSTAPVVLVNETAVRQMGFTQPMEALGQVIALGNEQYTVAGIVKDYQSQSLRFGSTPHVFIYNRRYQTAMFRIHPQQQEAALKLVSAAFKKVYPDYYMDYTFLDDELRTFYSDESKLAHFLSLFSIVGILIGCLGVYGLVAYVCMRKTKEIGIRKVLGAGFLHIMALLNVEFLWLIGLAFVIAAPVAGLIMHRFLQEYTNRIALPGWIFLLTGAGAVVITLITISFQAVRASLANPVKSLRSE
ncbi:ABC transporter permease [Paraflavitalea pollutisoli]|uniref:ABC transporter permease n=1 Tax=Paraflavitalea pollutisoli TaxID=3034143 RepID=UPI0023EB9158|nr:ABC transporter permease [Paraflavitalea sp. H1-2-19X]